MEDSRKMLIEQAWRDAEDAFERGLKSEAQREKDPGPMLKTIPSFARAPDYEGESAVARFKRKHGRIFDGES